MNLIKFLLNFFDYFTQKNILNIFKNEIDTKKSIVSYFYKKKIYSFEPNIKIFKIKMKLRKSFEYIYNSKKF